jgi:hypothetical protein
MVDRSENIETEVAGGISTGDREDWPIQKANFADTAAEAIRSLAAEPDFNGTRSDRYQQVRILLTMAQRLSDMARPLMPRLPLDCSDRTAVQVLYRAEDDMQAIVNELHAAQRATTLGKPA